MAGKRLQADSITLPKQFGSIIKLFDKTKLPRKQSDVVCPHFWELKAFNGCRYDCQWCLDGETRILMDDLSWKNLENINVGDYVIGFERHGSSRLVRTPVLATHEAMKERIKLTTDKAEVISSYEHRFLSYLGRWATARHLATAEGGIKFLTEPTKTASFTKDYKTGYLRGISDGDGTMGTYNYGKQKHYKYRLAMADIEAIDRAETFFADLGVRMKRFKHRAGSGAVLEAIRKDGKLNYRQIETILNRWGPFPDCELGYIAGIFDAEGSFNGHTIRLSNTNAVILARIETCLSRLGWKYKRERFKQKVTTIRIEGGIKEYIKIFNMTQPAIKRKQEITGKAVRFDVTSPILKAERLGPGKLYDIQTGTENFIANGLVSHNCYLNGTFRFRVDKDTGKPLGKKPYLKDMNEVINQLKKALVMIRPRQLFNSGEVSDSLVFERQLVNGIIPIFQDDRFNPHGHKLLVLTKSASIFFLAASAPDRMIVSHSVNAEYVSDRWELLAPNPWKRLGASRTAADRGYETRLRIDPLVPVVNWQTGYRALCKRILELNPHVSVITLGSLRGLTSTINEARKLGKDMTWSKYLAERSSWGLKIAHETRRQMYALIIEQLRDGGYKGDIALCKETLAMWKQLKDDCIIKHKPGDVKCNCIL